MGPIFLKHVYKHIHTNLYKTFKILGCANTTEFKKANRQIFKLCLYKLICEAVMPKKFTKKPCSSCIIIGIHFIKCFVGFSWDTTNYVKGTNRYN